MQILCDGHHQIVDISTGMQFVSNSPTVLNQPVLEGATDVDAAGAFYNTVIRDGGIYRMWYQAQPRDWTGANTFAVACAESDDGLHWRRPNHRLVEVFGNRDNPLTDLPFTSPSVFIDPDAPPAARYRAFGHCDPRRALAGTAPILNRSGYCTAHSADGLHWQLDSTEPLWPWADVITSAYDPKYHRAILAMKRWRRSAGMERRAFMTAEWSAGQTTEPVSAFVPDEYDDFQARLRGFNSADYYGVSFMPTAGPTVGFLWNFRHRLPFGTFGDIGRVDLSLVYQLERHGKWHHLAGRPDWLSAEQAPDWANCLYPSPYPIDVGDETRLYFSGTKDFHGACGEGVAFDQWIKANLGEDGSAFKIGLMTWKKNRLIGYCAIMREVITLSPPTNRPSHRLILNGQTRPGGMMRVALLNADDRTPVPGYEFENCEPLSGDFASAAVRWKGQTQLPFVGESCPFVAHIEMTYATLWAFDFES